MLLLLLLLFVEVLLDTVLGLLVGAVGYAVSYPGVKVHAVLFEKGHGGGVAGDFILGGKEVKVVLVQFVGRRKDADSHLDQVVVLGDLSKVCGVPCRGIVILLRTWKVEKSNARHFLIHGHKDRIG